MQEGAILPSKSFQKIIFHPGEFAIVSRFSIKLERPGSLCLTDPVENVQGYLKELETIVSVLKLYNMI
jgi:hypothetical protein